MKRELRSFTAHENSRLLSLVESEKDLLKGQLTSVGVDLDVNGHQDVGGAAGVGDTPSRDDGRSSGWELVVSRGQCHSLDLAISKDWLLGLLLD